MEFLEEYVVIYLVSFDVGLYVITGKLNISKSIFNISKSFLTNKYIGL